MADAEEVGGPAPKKRRLRPNHRIGQDLVKKRHGCIPGAAYCQMQQLKTNDSSLAWSGNTLQGPNTMEKIFIQL